MNIEPIRELYIGFFISDPAGNNAFSFEKRKRKQIYVPPLVEAAPAQLALGENIVFSEIEDGIEKNFAGLKQYIYFTHQGKDIFIFDNHNHAFFFWMAAYLQGKLSPGQKLIHVDQHKDTREPDGLFPFSLQGGYDLKDIFNYTNFYLNVGNFIPPALKLGLFSEVEMIDSSTAFENPVPDNFVLDLDMDIFSDEMDYINFNLKIEKIKKYIEKTSFITIATSPFFINQQKAIRIIQQIFA